jgi:enolase
VLLKVNQIGTITEALDMIQLAYRNGYGVMPCSSRGEGADIADYCVGINAGTVRESGTGPSANRFLQIEAELGPRAKFLGKKGLKGARFQK